jgi:carboxymethylenebutenolidase
MMGETRRLQASDGHQLDAYHADAATPLKGGVVVLQTAFGLNSDIKAVCHDYAARGYDVVAPALYDRQRRNAVFGHDEAGSQQARVLRRGLDYDKVLLDAEAAIASLRGCGEINVVGYCVGGSAAWLAACRLPIHAASCYYPSDIGQQLDETPRCSVMIHFAEHDHIITPATVRAFLGKYPDVPAFIYPAGHGFNGRDREDGHDAASAKLALERTLRLFAGHSRQAEIETL